MRWAIGTLVVVLGTALFAAVGAYLYMNSESGRDSLVRLLSENLSSAGTVVRIERLSGNLPQQIDLRGIVVNDADGEWLRLDNVRIEWRPLELIKGRLHITQAAFSKVLVSRPPLAEDAPPQDAFTWPDLPFSVALDMVSLTDLTLAEPILGQALTLRATGTTALAADGGVHTRFSAERSDGAPGTASLEARFNPARQTLDIEADMHAPDGGALAGAFDIPGVALKLSGSGPLQDWHAEFEAHSGDAAKLIAKIRLQAGDNRYRFSISGDADIALLLGAPFRELATNGVSFALDGSLPELTRLNLTSVRLASDAATLQLEGRISTADIDLKAGLRVADRGSAWLQKHTGYLSARDLKLNARASGPLLQPLIHVELEAASFSTPEVASTAGATGSFDLSIDQPFTHGGLPATVIGSGKISGVNTKQADLRRLLAEPLNWSFEAKLSESIEILEIIAAEVSTGAAGLTASGRIGLVAETDTGSTHDPATSLDVSATLPDVTLFDAMTEFVQGGAARIHAKIETNDFAAGFTASVDAALDQLRFGDPVADALIGQNLRAHTDLSVDHLGALRASQLSATSDAVKLNGEWALSSDRETVHAKYKIELDSITGLLPSAASGSVSIDGSARGETANPSLTAAAAFRDISIAGLAAASGRIDIEVAEIASNPSGRVRADIDHSVIGTVKAETVFHIPNFDGIELTAIELTAGGTSVTGELRAPLSEGAVQGRISGRVDEFSQWSAAAGHDLSGTTTFDLVLDEIEDVQNAHANLQLSGAGIQIDESQYISVGDAALAMQISDPLGTPRGKLQLNAHNAKLGGIHLDRLSLDVAAESPDRASVDLTLAGNLPAALQVAANGTVSRRQAGLAATLNKFNAQIGDNMVRMDDSTTLVVTPELLSIDDLSLIVGEGRLRVNADIASDAIDADIELSNLPLSLLELAYADAQVAGAVSGAARLRGKASAPSGDLELSFDDIRQKVPWARQLPALSGAVQGDWRDSQLTLAGKVTGIGEAGLEWTTSLPLALAAGSLTPLFTPTEPVSVRASWRGPIEPLLRLLPSDEHNLSGLAELDIEVGGSLESPRANGSLTLEQGMYEYYPHRNRAQGPCPCGWNLTAGNLRPRPPPPTAATGVFGLKGPWRCNRPRRCRLTSALSWTKQPWFAWTNSPPARAASLLLPALWRTFGSAVSWSPIRWKHGFWEALHRGWWKST